MFLIRVFLNLALISCSIKSMTKAASLVKKNSNASLAEGCEVLSVLVKENRLEEENYLRTVRCACGPGKVAGTHREAPACVPDVIIKTRRWCEMLPCLENETCHLLATSSGWICSLGDKLKRTVVKDDQPDTPEVSTEITDFTNGDVTSPFTSLYDDVTMPFTEEHT